MIILLRGNHGSGKSTVVRKILAEVSATPTYGLLGTRMPEAYCCLRRTTPKHVKGPPFFVLGPYESPATAGCDYVTKLGVATMEEFLERYRQRGNILFESIMTSVRILEPSIGRWIAVNKKDMIVATLTTTFEQCEEAIKTRKLSSQSGHRWNSTHLKAQQVMFDRVTKQYDEMGFRQEYVSRDEMPKKILGWFYGRR